MIVRDGQVPADVVVGDVLATPVTGAYGHSMASTYNKVPRPPVVFVRDGVARVVVRRETLDDLIGAGRIGRGPAGLPAEAHPVSARRPAPASAVSPPRGRLSPRERHAGGAAP